jgi:hypothetical protein
MGNATRTYAFAPTRLVPTVVVERLRATCVELQLAPRLVRDHIYVVSRTEIPRFAALTEWTIEERGSYAVISTTP